MCVGLALMFRLLLFILRFSTSSSKLVHGFSKWFQSNDTFLHVVNFWCQGFDGMTPCNTLFSQSSMSRARWRFAGTKNKGRVKHDVKIF